MKNVAVACFFLGKLESNEVIMKKLTKEQLKSLKLQFQRYDKNEDGKLTVAEFSKAVEHYYSPETFKQLLRELNPDNNDKITWKEFLDDYKKDVGAND